MICQKSKNKKWGEDMKKYYDPGYDREITEEGIKKQYELFRKHKWFHKTFEEFKKENFYEKKEKKVKKIKVKDLMQETFFNAKTKIIIKTEFCTKFESSFWYEDKFFSFYELEIEKFMFDIGQNELCIFCTEIR